ncbi:hypothetical protein F4819DRAFT_458339 [Hypoxylon fuscum]|nr:hypothetical protein F4819DRAFT_458339 [Hypoxylon fuscum]
MSAVELKKMEHAQERNGDGDVSPVPAYEGNSAAEQEQQPFIRAEDRDLEAQEPPAYETAPQEGATATAAQTSGPVAKGNEISFAKGCVMFVMFVVGLFLIVTGVVLLLKLFIWIWEKLGII